MFGLVNLINSGNLVTLLTQEDNILRDPEIVNRSPHFYSVVAAIPMVAPLIGWYDTQFIIRNPWGPATSMPEYVVVDWSQLSANFQGVQHA